MSLEPGTRIDRYRIEQRIGTGGMAEVYAITHARLGHRAALKVLTTGNRNVARRMVDEGRAQAQLHHPNIVRVFDFIEHEGAPALVMELVEGPDLAEFLSETRPSLEQALVLFDGMLQGVAAAHAAGLVHRDLKPGNILLSPGRDGGWVPKVTDFGMVKPLHDPERPNLTRTGVTLGTLAYMAPEQFRGARRVDHRADIFGLGCHSVLPGLRAPPPSLEAMPTRSSAPRRRRSTRRLARWCPRCQRPWSRPSSAVCAASQSSASTAAKHSRPCSPERRRPQRAPL